MLAYSQDDKVKLDEGTLDLIDNQIVQTTGTIRLRADLSQCAAPLWPGELVNARLLLETRTDGLTVAASAVQQGPNGSYVYVIGSDGTAQMRPVTVAQISDGQALIDSGLKANETSWSTASTDFSRAPWSSAARQSRATSRPAERRGAGNPVNISAPFIHRPIATALLMVGLLLCGLVTYRLLPVAALPNVNYPDDPGISATARRRPANDGILGGNPARAAALANSRRYAADFVECAWLHPAHHPVRSQPRHRQRRGRCPVRDQCSQPISAAQYSLSADDPEGESRRHPDPGPRH